VTPNEHDDYATARDTADERTDGESAASITPMDTDPDTGADEGQYDPYITSGANPFSSVHPTGSGMFPRLQPREFPPDEPPASVPEMEQLSDPNALPEPGYPAMAGYQQAFPPGAFPPAFPPGAFQQEAFQSAFPVKSSVPRSEDTSTFRVFAEPSPADSRTPRPAYPESAYPESAYPEPSYPEPSYPGSLYQQLPYPSEPYVAPRSPEAAPPLTGPAQQPGPGPQASVRPPSRTEGDAPLLASVPSPAAPPFGSPVSPVPMPPTDRSGRETADSLTTDLLLQGRRPLPNAGWRRTLYKATGGLIRVGESAADMHRRDLINRARTPVAGGHHRVAVMSLKGGVGKTTTAVGLGATLASLRGDRVIAMDANPDRGTLSDKVRLETSATVRDLLNERAQVTRYADVRAFTSQASSRLEILASDRDPGVSIAFSADDYRAVARVLEHYYSICITDCGTGLLHSAMSGILELADHIVLVSSPSVDGARSASATLDWLEAHGYGDLVGGGVVALSTIRPKSRSTVDLDRLEQHFASRCRAVVRIPYDAHLEEGAEVELDMLGSNTADAYLELAALVGDGFAMPRRPVVRATPGMPFA
jgi:MinD-like ATPase involved in chromosome partitioning or flagellar assembly